jgi:hypothetical protein
MPLKFHPNSHLNKHGYYSVGDKPFYSKLEAIEHSISVNDKVCWHFNDAVFSEQNWTQEPSQDIKSMYKQRAQSIRDQFDYVVVMFSGGADSTTVLDSFIDNNIPVDEIYINYWTKYQPEKENSFMNAEITYSALPYLKKKLPTAWNTHVRLYDPSDFMLTCLQDAEFRERSYYEVNTVHNLQMISIHYNLHRRFDEYKQIIDQGKRLAFVWGEAKPKIQYDVDKQKHYFYFEDHYAHAPQPRDQAQNDSACNHEQFFDDPAYPEIKIKQCHLILNTLKQISHRKDIFFLREETGSNCRGISAETYFENQLYVLDRNAFNFAIYPEWNFLTYHQDKTKARLLHPAHAWVEQIEPDAARAWFNGYIKKYGHLPKEWTAYYGNLKYGLKRIKIPYYLE